MREKLWNRNYIKVMTANFTLFFAFYLLTPLLPIYLKDSFNASKDVIGLVLSGYTVLALLGRPITGYLIDTYPRRTVLLTCFALFFIFFGGYLAASSLLLFTIVRTLHGMPFGALTVANSTVAIDVLPSSRRNEGIGYYGLSNNLAMAIAPSVGIFIYKYTDNFHLLFWIALVIAGIGLAVDATLKLPQRQTVNNKRKLTLDRFFLTRGWMLAVNMVFHGFCFGVLSNYLAIYGKEVLHKTGGTGTYFMLLSVGLVLSRLQGAKGLREGRLTRNVGEGTIMSLIGYTIFVAFPSDWSYYLSALLIGLGNGHLWPGYQNMIISMARHDQRGTANSTLLVAWDVGIGLGVLAGGMVCEHLGYSSAFWMVAFVHALAVAMFFLATKAFFERRRLE